MNRKVEYALLVLVIGGLGAYLVLRRTNRIHYRLPDLPVIHEEDVTRIEIQRAGSGFSIQRAGEGWILLPAAYPADGRVINRMLQALEGLRLTALASTSKNYGVYHLDDANRLDVKVFGKDKLLLSLAIGKPTATHRHTFVRIAGDDRVYHAEKNLRSRFNKDVSALRDKQVMKIDEEVSEILLTAGGRSIQVHRVTPAEGKLGQGTAPEEGEAGEGGQGTGGWKTGGGKRVEGRTIDPVIRMLSNLRCDGFLEGKTKEDLKEPSLQVSLRGERNYEVSLYDKEGEKVVAVSSQRDYPFLISQWKADRIRKAFKNLAGGSP